MATDGDKCRIYINGKTVTTKSQELQRKEETIILSKFDISSSIN